VRERVRRREPFNLPRWLLQRRHLRIAPDRLVQFRNQRFARRNNCALIATITVLAAMKNGGKASVVVPLTAVYPMVVCALSPFLLHEHITLMQGVGIGCGMGAIFLLAN